MEKNVIDKIVTGRDLKLMRLHAGKSPEEMTTLLGHKSAITYNKWESDESGPDLNQWLHIVMYLGFNPSTLIDAALERDGAQQDLELEKLVATSPK